MPDAAVPCRGLDERLVLGFEDGVSDDEDPPVPVDVTVSAEGAELASSEAGGRSDENETPRTRVGETRWRRR